MGSRVAIDRVEPHAGRRSRNLHHELSSFHSRSQSSADANANGRGAGNLKSPIASTDAPTPPPLFLVHRIGDDTSSNISTLDLSPILHRRLTTAQDTVQLARDEEALVEKWLGDGHGWIGMNAGEDDLLSANGKVKKKRNVNRNWSPCVGCREKKVKCLRLNPDAPCKRCQDVGLSGQCRPYNERAADGSRVRQPDGSVLPNRMSEYNGDKNAPIPLETPGTGNRTQAQARTSYVDMDTSDTRALVAFKADESRASLLSETQCQRQTNAEPGRRTRLHFDGRTLPQPKPSISTTGRPLHPATPCMPAMIAGERQPYVRHSIPTDTRTWACPGRVGSSSTPSPDTRSGSSSSAASSLSPRSTVSVTCDIGRMSDDEEGAYTRERHVEHDHATRGLNSPPRLENLGRQKGPWRPWTPGP